MHHVIDLANPPRLGDAEFDYIARLLFEHTGITIVAAKKAMVVGRLSRRLSLHGLHSYAEYVALLRSGRHPGELQTAIDLLTTNETYFFREPKHFEWLKHRVAQARRAGERLRIWSAASSSGEEAYTAAMVCEDNVTGGAWEVVGTDISTRMVEAARSGLYPIAHAKKIPPDLLRRFCLRGVGPEEGRLLINRTLRDRVSFRHANLNEPQAGLGMFQVVFLRNVMIYFNTETRRRVIGRVLAQLVDGGHLLIGHSESLHDVTDRVRYLAPAIYLKTH